MWNMMYSADLFKMSTESNKGLFPSLARNTAKECISNLLPLIDTTNFFVTTNYDGNILHLF